MSNDKLSCRWLNCQKSFESAEGLYSHLSDDHVGRRSTNNLCLQCRWNNCGIVAVKRDHLASHIRVHLPLKPHVCSICDKGFKRPQDLKKHEKIHTEEHQSSLLSKQPGYKPVRRRRKTVYQGRNLGPLPMNSSSQGSITSDMSSLTYSPPMQSGVSLTESPVKDEGFYPYGNIKNATGDFTQNVLYNQNLPNYDAEMINRLNEIAPTIDYIDNLNWSVPADLGSAQVLQDWLEQISSNIQNNEDSKVAMTTDYYNNNDTFIPDQQQDNLYPKLTDLPSDPYFALTPNSFIDLHPVNTERPSTPSQISPSKTEVSPQFWSPSLINSQQNQSSSSYSLSSSDMVDFSSPTSHSDYPTSQTKQELVCEVTPTLNSAGSFNNKKDLIHMMNVFSSPKDIKKPTKTQPKKEKKNLDKEQVVCQTFKEEEDSSISPYADLVNMISHMNMEDTRPHPVIIDTPQTCS
ncbi:hypothetical protein G6F52_001021 [Rhizopus delemar]|nr:hypothetical protein G6F52_001021 [Rhizopus delemar]